jgi:hypothetical protein
VESKKKDLEPRSNEPIKKTQNPPPLQNRESPRFLTSSHFFLLPFPRLCFFFSFRFSKKTKKKKKKKKERAAKKKKKKQKYNSKKKKKKNSKATHNDGEGAKSDENKALCAQIHRKLRQNHVKIHRKHMGRQEKKN